MCVAFDPQGNTLASGGYDDQLKLWTLAVASCGVLCRSHFESLRSAHPNTQPWQICASHSCRQDSHSETNFCVFGPFCG